jgi:hypothetical protein
MGERDLAHAYLAHVASGKLTTPPPIVGVGQVRRCASCGSTRLQTGTLQGFDEILKNAPELARVVICLDCRKIGQR